MEATESKLLLCSASLPWRGFRLRKQLFLPKSFFGSSLSGTDRHLISMLCSPVSRGERLNRNGQYIRYTKLYGAITILPSRFVAPPEHLITPSEYLPSKNTSSTALWTRWAASSRPHAISAT